MFEQQMLYALRNVKLENFLILRDAFCVTRLELTLTRKTLYAT